VGAQERCGVGYQNLNLILQTFRKRLAGCSFVSFLEYLHEHDKMWRRNAENFFTILPRPFRQRAAW